MSVLTPAVIDAGPVRLRPWAERDVDRLPAIADDPVNTRFTGLPSPYGLSDARAWVTAGAPAAWAAGAAAFAVVDPVTDEPLGGVGIGLPVPARGQCEIGYWVAASARGRGVATAATRALTDWLFTQGFTRIELLTDVDNTASQRVALACGYRFEARRRGAGRGRDGGPTDLMAFVRLAGDPTGPAPRLLPDMPPLDAPGVAPGDGRPGRGLTDGVVTLRALQTRDAADLLALASLPEVQRTHIGPPITPEAAGQRCREAEVEWIIGRRADCAILDAATGEFAGDIGLWYFESVTQQAMIGYSLLRKFRGRGFASRAARLISDWGFAEVGAVRVIAGTFPYNDASRAVLQRAGFVLEGTQLKRLPGPDGTRIDDIVYVRFAPES